MGGVDIIILLTFVVCPPNAVFPHLTTSSPLVTGFYRMKQTFRCTLSKIFDLRYCTCIFNILLKPQSQGKWFGHFGVSLSPQVGVQDLVIEPR